MQVPELILTQMIELYLPFKKENSSVRLENSALKDEIKIKNEKLKTQL